MTDSLTDMNDARHNELVRDAGRYHSELNIALSETALGHPTLAANEAWDNGVCFLQNHLHHRFGKLRGNLYKLASELSLTLCAALDKNQVDMTAMRKLHRQSLIFTNRSANDFLKLIELTASNTDQIVALLEWLHYLRLNLHGHAESLKTNQCIAELKQKFDKDVADRETVFKEIRGYLWGLKDEATRTTSEAHHRYTIQRMDLDADSRKFYRDNETTIEWGFDNLLYWSLDMQEKAFRSIFPQIDIIKNYAFYTEKFTVENELSHFTEQKDLAEQRKLRALIKYPNIENYIQEKYIIRSL